VTKPQNENPYLLLTPGPLSTSPSVKAVMLRDWCTWDDDYNQGVVQVIRRRLVELATRAEGYTSVLMQGSGTFVVERKTCVNTAEMGQMPNLVETIRSVIWSETRGAAETAKRNADELLGSAYMPNLENDQV